MAANPAKSRPTHHKPLATLLLLATLTSCDFSPQPLHFSGATMDTSYTVKIPTPPSNTPPNLHGKITLLLADINQRMSTYLPNSELSQFNNSQSLQWQKVSKPLFVVLQEAVAVGKISGGAFDITVGALVDLWGFGAGKSSRKVPSPAAIAASKKQVGSHYLQLDAANTMIKKLIPALRLDLSAIAKGYATDQVAKLLESHNIADYMVEIGGELRLKGSNIGGNNWQIALEKPDPTSRSIQQVLSLTNTALATSGDYRNYFTQAGSHYSHTIDPPTAKPTTHKLASVTVLSHTAMRADALATALMVLGEQKGLQLANAQNIAALFISKTKTGFHKTQTPLFQQTISPPSPEATP